MDGAVLDAITRLEATSRAARTEMQAFRDDITGRVNALERRMTVQGFNVVARLRNSQIRSHDTPFAPVQNQNGEVPLIFPANLSALLSLRSNELSDLLRVYGIEPGHSTVDEKTRMFKLHIGFIDVECSVQSLTVPKTDGDHHKTYPTRFQIPTNSLLGLNQEQQLKRAEVFALGSLLYEIISGSVPFENLSDDEVQLRYSRGEYPGDIQSLPRWQSILGCWNLEFAQEMVKFIKAQDPEAKGSGLFSPVRNYAEAHPYLLAIQMVSLAVTAAPVIAPPLLGAAGFAALGPVAGSAAAAWQSSIGVVQAGSWFAWCQSAAMGGAAWSGIAASGAAGAGVATATTVPVILGVAERCKSVYRRITQGRKDPD
ncbi:MAG: hypothetical protein M1830_003053 [Pleopsidium flavum]|nr:MAG: hypothetical protein M1830_003053 [Pleopsidium flavum]